MTNTISVIIPIYKVQEKNNSHYFEKLIKSISINLSNCLDRDILKEVIIVNDFPNHDSTQFIKHIFIKYNLLDKLVIISNKENLGQARARNIGALQAKGNYLHFIDQDDYISDNFYSLLLSKKGADIIFGHPYLHYEGSHRIRNAFKFSSVLLFKYSKYLSNMKILLFCDIAYSPGQYIISKFIFEQIGQFPLLTHRGCDDYGLLFNLANKKKIKIAYQNNAKFFYRIHLNQNRKSLNMRNSITEFFSLHNRNNLSFRIFKWVKTKNNSIIAKFIWLIFFKK